VSSAFAWNGTSTSGFRNHLAAIRARHARLMAAFDAERVSRTVTRALPGPAPAQRGGMRQSHTCGDDDIEALAGFLGLEAGPLDGFGKGFRHG
jgi:hypothetical protein